jgi:hypothetical protein
MVHDFLVVRREGLHAVCPCGENPLATQLLAEGIVSGIVRWVRAYGGLSTGALMLLLAGCAGDSAGSGGDPGPTELSAGETCQSIRANLNKLDSQGVPAIIERQTSGKKLSPAQKAQADLYNQLLNKYLGARCHV